MILSSRAFGQQILFYGIYDLLSFTVSGAIMTLRADHGGNIDSVLKGVYNASPVKSMVYGRGMAHCLFPVGCLLKEIRCHQIITRNHLEARLLEGVHHHRKVIE